MPSESGAKSALNARISKRKRGFMFAGVAFVALLVALWQGLGWWSRNEPVEIAAQKILLAFEQKDIDTLWNYSHSGEKVAFGLDRLKFEKVFREYIWVQPGSPKPGRIVKQKVGAGNVMELTRFYEIDDREIMFDIVVFQTEEGPKSNVLTPAVYTVFDQKYGGGNSGLTGSSKVFQTRLDGALKERLRLESFGITGTKDSAPGRPMVPWDQHIQILSQHLKGKK